MKDRLKTLFLLFSFGVIIGCSEFQEYQPQVFNGHEIVAQPDLLTDEHKKNLIQVLDYYEVEWKKESGKIFIDSHVDKELMWNYTTKANDPEWLETHKPEPK